MNKKNILIIGAGNAGETLAFEILTSDNNKEYNILCFLDDDENKKQVKINENSIDVKGKIKDIGKIIEEYKNGDFLKELAIYIRDRKK